MPALQFPGLNALFLSRRWSRGQLQGSFPPATSLDPLGTAIAKGLAAGNAKRRPTQEIRKAARAIRDNARATGAREAAILELEAFVSDYPAVEEFQKIVARLLHEMHDERALGAWLGVSLRFPQSMDSFHNLVLLTQRHKGLSAVRTVLQARFPRMPKRLDQLLAYAEACDVAGETLKRRAAFDRLARIFAKRNDSWLLATSWLEEEWGINRSAGTILRRLAAGTGLGAPILRDSQRLQTVVGEWEQNQSRAVDQGALASVKVLGALFDRVLESRRSAALLPSRDTGSLLLLTGSLGTGGAERQLVTTAIGLSQMNLGQRTLQDGLVLDPVNVMARSLRDRKDGAFFLSDLQQAGVPVRSYRELPDFAGDLATSAVRPALSALGFLPWSTAEAVIKLTDQLRLMKPEVVHIWQDGLVYAAGLAALLAGVPRIILSGRSTPPPDRRENYLVEYDIIYRSLLREPGVKLSVNSRYAANRYAGWLNMDPALIEVVPNGVARASDTAEPGAEAAFRAFEERTGSSSLTLGAVMRLDEVKRPLLWIDVAASVLANIPNARFIIVGDGPFRTKAEKRAEALGLAGRCLFVGRSTCVGYWLSKMDALMLLSEHEGLPNALIEAQLAGVPVITSPAGGAPETLIPGTTGIVTSQSPTPHEVADMIAGLVAQSGCLKKMGISAEKWASETFPISHMLSKTLQVYASAGRVEAFPIVKRQPLAAVEGAGAANV
jgi:glycosyltransferase involved in cell wall biosynthesis